MAGRPRTADKGTGVPRSPGKPTGTISGGGTGGLTGEVRPDHPAEGRFEGKRSATVDLPFMTAQFRVPDIHMPELHMPEIRMPEIRMPEVRPPTREDLDSAGRKALSVLPPPKTLLFFGGLAATAVIGAIEWPVAAAIGIGSALAGRGAAKPEPRGDGPQVGGMRGARARN
ncbi:hypothetical protein GCM10010464_14080 [Pseudonocardia yunnanensis]|uniref:DUF3040 domain-containing protein n=1 Tax=Pseudonocardia yunnanensis TaxID=58107 RepID=A0ABW4ESQ1_9PSEU